MLDSNITCTPAFLLDSSKKLNSRPHITDMSKIPRAEDLLYKALPTRSKLAIKQITREIKTRSKRGNWSVKLRLLGPGIRPHAIARILDARGYSTTVETGDDTTITVDWRCFCPANGMF